MTKWTDLKIPITDDDSGISAHITYKHVRGVVRIIRLSNVVVCLFAFLGNEEDPNFHFRQEREREREREMAKAVRYTGRVQREGESSRSGAPLS